MFSKKKTTIPSYRFNYFADTTPANPYDVSIMLTEVLEERTGSQGWFEVGSSREMTGWPIYFSNDRARQLWRKIDLLPEMRALSAAAGNETMTFEPNLAGCPMWDDRDQRAINALYWTRKAEAYERTMYPWAKDSAREARAKAQQFLNGTTYVTCDLGYVHSRSGDKVSLPTPEDIRRMVERVVSKHLVPFLVEDREKVS